MDSLGEKNASLKQQLNSLLYLKKIIDNRMNRLHTKDTDSYGEPSQVYLYKIFKENPIFIYNIIFHNFRLIGTRQSVQTLDFSSCLWKIFLKMDCP